MKDVQPGSKKERALRDLVGWGYVKQLPDGSYRLTEKGEKLKDRPIPELRKGNAHEAWDVMKRYT